MEKFLIILLPEKLYVYKLAADNDFEVFHINGEEILNISRDKYSKDFEDLKNEIIDVCNLEDLKSIGFDIVYHKVDTDVIKQLSDVLLPCSWWQVFSFEKILPELLLKIKKIKPNASINVMFEGNNYFVGIDEKGYIQSCLSENESELNIEVEMIPQILNSCYEFVTNEQALKKKELEFSSIEKVNEELTNKINLLENENKKLVESHAEFIIKTIKKDELIKTLKQKHTVVEKRSIIRVIKPEEQLGKWYMGSFGMKKLKVKWSVLNGDLVKKNQEVAVIQQIYSDGTIGKTRALYSVNSGRIFIVVSADSEVTEGQILSVVSDPADSMEDIKEWVREMA